ncbi:N-alpha-acetyltransferase 30A [Taenia crassiceps]|uniref:N-alpha-acetyltransferase 30A n=1 Tax=Taenia crassiceps TaxID=6207 RepID=A0ABR4QNL4_9CEST
MDEFCGDGSLDLAAGLSVLNLSEKRRDPLFVDEEHGVVFRQYEGEGDLENIVALITKDLSEPYSLYTYRYFIYNWPELCLLRGYIAMLAVEKEHRRKKIGSTLVQLAVEIMIQNEAQEVVLEAEVDNKPALALYEQLGFSRDKYLFRYYLTGTDAYRLKLWLDT